MLKRDQVPSELPHMTSEQLAWHREAVAEEEAGKDANLAMARELLPALQEQVQRKVAIVNLLKQARAESSVSLDELQKRTGMPKSAISRLENSKNPNPTLATMMKYAEAIGLRLELSLSKD